MTPQDVLYPNVETEGRNNNQLGNKISQEFYELPTVQLGTLLLN